MLVKLMQLSGNLILTLLKKKKIIIQSQELTYIQSPGKQK